MKKDVFLQAQLDYIGNVHTLPEHTLAFSQGVKHIGDEELSIRTELKGGVGKYGRLLGWLYIGDAEVSLNEQMITEGYAWEYDGGTKQKDFEELREIRRSFGTLVES